MRVFILLGAPGSGKGTQAKLLSQTGTFVHLSTGDMLRQAIAEKTELGNQAKGFIEKGELVPDPLILGMIAERLPKLSAEAQVLLDGFPRTLPQAQALDNNPETKADLAVHFEIPESNLVERITGRRVARKSGETYHVRFNPPKVDGVCDKSGEALIQRNDDTEQVVRHRLEVYKKQTAPLLDYYEKNDKLKQINADRPIKDIHEELIRVLR